MKPIRFLMIGGFLGAGKTTTIARLAKHYQDAGLKVGLVTNDQAYNLVDTQTLRAQGFQVGEVPGACFCCKFDDLIDTVSDLSSQQLPDMVIAEPVGSCTDLYATIIQPMRELFGDRFELGPLIVLLKPTHGRKILADKKGRGFSPKAEYIFLKQLEEADAIAINKIDRMDGDAANELLGLVENRFPEIPAFGVSAREGTGFERMIELANTVTKPRESYMAMDYDTYAEGEAELGWLNCQVTAAAEEKFELDEVVLAIISEIGSRLIEAKCEIAHLKALGQTMTEASVANIVDSSSEAELSLASEIKATAADLLVNARVAASPEQLTEFVESACAEVGKQLSVKLTVGGVQSFRPGRPEPTHRSTGS